MPELIQPRTQRLLLRQWKTEDRHAFSQLNADPEVMAFFMRPLARAESDALADRCQYHIATHGWGLWALEIPGVAPFAGFVGLSVPTFDAHFCPCVEIGWRLARPYWGKGYATEAANATLAAAFGQLELAQIVSFTSEINLRSRALMARIGMRGEENFAHPDLPGGHKLTPHVLYRLSRQQWQQRA